MGPVNLFIKRKQVSYRMVSPIALNAYGGRLLFSKVTKVWFVHIWTNYTLFCQICGANCYSRLWALFVRIVSLSTKIISSMDSEAWSSKPAARRRGAMSGSIFLYRLDSYISLLIIPCIIYYVTNKETLTLTLRRIMSLMRLYSLTASDLEDWASSGEEPGTHLSN